MTWVLVVYLFTGPFFVADYPSEGACQDAEKAWAGQMNAKTLCFPAPKGTIIQTYGGHQ